MYIVGITLLQCVVFSVIYGLTVLRERLVPNREKATSGKVLEDDDGVQYFPLQHSDRSVGEVCFMSRIILGRARLTLVKLNV